MMRVTIPVSGSESAVEPQGKGSPVSDDGAETECPTASQSITSSMNPFDAHYGDRQCMAHAYLLTAAAKALVLTDDGVVVERKTYLSGLVQEAHAAAIMHRDDQIRRFMFRLSGPGGVSCIKRARNGTQRRIDLRLKMKTTHDELVWKTAFLGRFFGRNRRFLLKNLRIAFVWDECKDINPTGAAGSSGASASASAGTSTSRNTKSKSTQVTALAYAGSKTGAMPGARVALEYFERPRPADSPLRYCRTYIRQQQLASEPSLAMTTTTPWMFLTIESRTLELRFDSCDDTDAMTYCIDRYLCHVNNNSKLVNSGVGVVADGGSV